MALQVRAFTSASTAGAATNIGLTIPGATQAGDLILEFLETTSTNVVQTPPAGWNAITALTQGNSSSSLRGASRLAQVGDAGTVATFTSNTNTRLSASIIVLYDDAGGTARIEQLTQTGTNSQSTSIATPSIDPQNNDDLLLAVFGGTGGVNGEQPVLSPAPGYTLHTQATSTSGTLRNAVLGIASMPLANGNVVPQAIHSSSLSLAAVGASILISFHNITPVANAGPDQVVDAGAVVTLDGTTSSDFDGTIAQYAWTQISGNVVTLSDASAAQPTFTAPSSVSGATLVFGLVVTDNDGTPSSQDAVTITVSPTPFQHVWNGSAMVKQKHRNWVGGAWV